jgi:hypothetical protein
MQPGAVARHLWRIGNFDIAKKHAKLTQLLHATTFRIKAASA